MGAGPREKGEAFEKKAGDGPTTGRAGVKHQNGEVGKRTLENQEEASPDKKESRKKCAAMVVCTGRTKKRKGLCQGKKGEKGGGGGQRIYFPAKMSDKKGQLSPAGRGWLLKPQRKNQG